MSSSKQLVIELRRRYAELMLIARERDLNEEETRELTSLSKRYGDIVLHVGLHVGLPGRATFVAKGG